MVWPAFARTGPFLTIPRSGLPPVGSGTWICNWPRDGCPPTASELPVKSCAPAAIFVRNSTKPFVSVIVTAKEYGHTSPDELVSAGGDTMITLAEGVKENKSSRPGFVTPPEVLVWSKLRVMLWLLTPAVRLVAVKYTRKG